MINENTMLEQNQSQRALAESIHGGFFLRKKPLESIATGYSYSGFAVVEDREPWRGGCKK
jgi:hypothetical protein